MNVTIAIYQNRGPSGLEWTTLGLGPHTRTRSGRSTVKLQHKLVDDLRTIIGELPVRDLAYFQPPRGIRAIIALISGRPARRRQSRLRVL